MSAIGQIPDFRTGTEAEWKEWEAPVPLDADTCKYWAGSPYWTPFEASYLLLGLVPNKGQIMFNAKFTTTWGSKVTNLEEQVSRAADLGDLYEEKVSKFDEELGDIVHSVVHRPRNILNWARRQNLEIPQTLWDMVMLTDDAPQIEKALVPTECMAGDVNKATDSSELVCFIEEFVAAKKRDNPGAQARYEKADRIVACAVWCMRKALLDGCQCRHDKLANIALDRAVDEKGAPLKRRMDEKKLYNLIRKEARWLVPAERQLRPGRSAYANNDDKCPVDSHTDYSVTRKGYSKPVRDKAKH